MSRLASSAAEADRRHWDRIEDLFHQVEALPPGQREAFLRDACAGDETIRARVASLLAAQVDAVDEVGALLRPRASPGEPGAGGEDRPLPDLVGPYRILREVGRGGLSSVFLAERADGSFRKHVALKLVRRGLDTGDILDRLRQERKILARLDHPNIARLLDGGSTDDGRPYFVMEYVEGLAVDEFCRRRRLDLDRRLELFRTICSAVHYAHRNLTIHRDIKPSNILVTEEGIPKLLDFGIAKVLEADGNQTTWQMTGPGLRFMTPAYASPEQVRGEALSTGTDVYSLGVLLFRLLTGASPFDLEGLPIHRLENLICEAPTPRAGQRLSAASMAAVGWRGISQKRLRGRLQGDLEIILSKALRKEPERRYGSVEQFSGDLLRHQRGLPVQARPDRWSYRAKKFARRHWRPLLAVGLMISCLAAVVSFYSLQLLEERNRALEAFTRAELESSKSARVTDFLQQIFEVSNPSRSLGERVTARELLDRGAEQIEGELSAEPEVQASLMEVISQSYAGLGLFQEASSQLERSFELRRRLFRAPHQALASSHEKLGELRISQGRYEEAQEHLRQALEQRRSVLGAEDPRTAESEGDLGALAHMLGRLEEAEDRYLEALEILEVRPGARGRETLTVQSNLVMLYYNRGRLGEAEELARRVLAVQQAELGPNHPDSISTEGKLAGILLAARRFEPAEAQLRRLWERQRELLGEDHPGVAATSNNLAAALGHLGRFDEAEVLYRKALAIQRRAHGERHRNTLRTMVNLAHLEAERRGNAEAARPLYHQALAHWRSLVGDGRPELLTPLIKLGALELGQGRPGIATAHLREAVQILEEDLAQPDPREALWRLAEARSLLGEALLRQGGSEAAAQLLPEAFETLAAELGEGHPKTLAAEVRLRRMEGPSR